MASLSIPGMDTVKCPSCGSDDDWFCVVDGPEMCCCGFSATSRELVLLLLSLYSNRSRKNKMLMITYAFADPSREEEPEYEDWRDR
jgi:hypothetical protein